MTDLERGIQMALKPILLVSRVSSREVNRAQAWFWGQPDSFYLWVRKQENPERMRKSSQWERIKSEDNDKHMKIFLQKIMQPLELLGIEF